MGEWWEIAWMSEASRALSLLLEIRLGFWVRAPSETSKRGWLGFHTFPMTEESCTRSERPGLFPRILTFLSLDNPSHRQEHHLLFTCSEC